MADLFKLAGRDVRVKEAEVADTALKVPPTSDVTIQSITASNIKNSTLLAADENGKIIPSTISALDRGDASTNDNQVIYNPVELKKGLTGNGSFTWTGPDESPLDVKFNAKSTQAAEMMGYPAETAVMSLSATPFGPVTLELFTHSTDSDVAIKLNQEGYATTIGVNGITIGGDKNLSWPTYGGALLTNGYFANANATDPSANDGKIPALEYPGTIPLKFIKPMVSMYASESDLPGGIHFSPFYVPDALYVTKDTNSIYRYNQDTESYIKLGPDTSKFLDKGTSSTVVNQVVYNPVEMKKALTVPSIQSPKYTDNSGNQQPLFTLGGTASGSGNTSQASSSLTLYRNRAGSWDSATIRFAPVDGLTIGNYAVGVQDWNRVPASYILTNRDGVTKDRNGCVKLKSSSGVSSDDFVFESVYNGKLHSKMSVGPSGLVTGGWCIDDKKIATVDVVRSTRDTLADHITAQAGGWIWLGKVAEKTYSLDLSEIKPGESGTTRGATCYVSINTFQQTIEGATQYKTVIDATCRCEPFELKPFPLSNVGSKWFMPRMLISPDTMQSDAFANLMAILYKDRIHVGMTVDECSVFRDMSLNANGSVSPIYEMNADSFSLFATIMELDRNNENHNIPVSGAHYRLTIFHPRNVL